MFAGKWKYLDKHTHTCFNRHILKCRGNTCLMCLYTCRFKLHYSTCTKAVLNKVVLNEQEKVRGGD